MQKIHVALIGDFNALVTAHQAIPKALTIAGRDTGHDVNFAWIHTSGLTGDTVQTVLAGYDAVWCVPASPYVSMDGALAAIRHARENRIPFLGTCGGYQHAVLEYTRTVLGLSGAGNVEVEPDATLPLIAPLVCALIDQSGDIALVSGSKIAQYYGAETINETYRCSYGFNRDCVPLFDNSDLRVSAWDQDGDPRAVELKNHPFFIGTAFQPERSGLAGENHPLISAYIRAAG
ncbi:MAG: hypothetical protein ABID63_05740 [Pseudomonadota bacterium]